MNLTPCLSYAQAPGSISELQPCRRPPRRQPRPQISQRHGLSGLAPGSQQTMTWYAGLPSMLFNKSTVLRLVGKQIKNNCVHLLVRVCSGCLAMHVILNTRCLLTWQQPVPLATMCKLMRNFTSTAWHVIPSMHSLLMHTQQRAIASDSKTSTQTTPG